MAISNTEALKEWQAKYKNSLTPDRDLFEQLHVCAVRGPAAPSARTRAHDKIMSA
jgi:hypothetical protein